MVVKGVGVVGGEGGFSRIRFTMKQNDEYVIAGLIDSINTPFVYRKGALMVCVGEGGAQSSSAIGGDLVAVLMLWVMLDKVLIVVVVQVQIV